jgi:hypothetical protein
MAANDFQATQLERANVAIWGKHLSRNAACDFKGLQLVYSFQRAIRLIRQKLSQVIFLPHALTAVGPARHAPKRASRQRTVSTYAYCPIWS